MTWIHIFYCARRVDAFAALGLQISGSEFRGGLVGPGPLWGRRNPQPAMESVDPSKMMPNSTSSSEPQGLDVALDPGHQQGRFAWNMGISPWCDDSIWFKYIYIKNLDFILGVELRGTLKDVVAGVHNLSDAESSDMFYAAAHTGVIFDYNTGVQRLLQGHVNPISATAVSKDKKWIVTADTGPDSMMVVWERESGTPWRLSSTLILTGSRARYCSQAPIFGDSGSTNT